MGIMPFSSGGTLCGKIFGPVYWPSPVRCSRRLGLNLFIRDYTIRNPGPKLLPG